MTVASAGKRPGTDAPPSPAVAARPPRSQSISGMRICHVIESTNAGSSRVVVDLARGGAAAGHDVTVVYSPNRAEKIFIDDLSAVPGLHLVHTPMHREVGLNDLVEGWRLLVALRRCGPFDVIHLHSSKAGGLGRLAGLFMPGAIKVYAPHAFVTMSPDASPVYGWMEKALSHLCDAIIVVSEQEQRHGVEHLGIAPRLLHLIPNGVSAAPECNRDAMRRRLQVDEGAFVIGFVGRLVEQKNPLRAFHAFARIAREHPRAVLAVIGGGPLEEPLRAAVRSEGLEQRVKLVGYAPAREYMPAFDCLLCSSDYESFGLIFPEALMASVPVVSTNVGIVPQLASAGGAVLAADELSPAALARGLDQMLRLPPEALPPLRQAAHLLSAPYSVEAMVARTAQLYQQLLVKKSASPLMMEKVPDVTAG